MSFDSGFEQHGDPNSFEAVMNRFADRMTRNHNQEPCYEELAHHGSRAKAIARRRELNGGIFPVPDFIAKKAVCEPFCAVHPRAPADYNIEHARELLRVVAGRFGAELPAPSKQARISVPLISPPGSLAALRASALAKQAAAK